MKINYLWPKLREDPLSDEPLSSNSKARMYMHYMFKEAPRPGHLISKHKGKRGPRLSPVAAQEAGRAWEGPAAAHWDRHHLATRCAEDSSVNDDCAS